MRTIQIGKNDEIIVCHRCKGSGNEPTTIGSVLESTYLAVMTMGMSLAMDMSTCEVCNGEGRLVIQRSN